MDHHSTIVAILADEEAQIIINQISQKKKEIQLVNSQVTKLTHKMDVASSRLNSTQCPEFSKFNYKLGHQRFLSLQSSRSYIYDIGLAKYGEIKILEARLIQTIKRLLLTMPNKTSSEETE